MRVVLRADASLRIGTGHVMRCLTLADSLRTAGADCLFVCRAHPGHAEQMIRDRGFDIRLLEAPSTTIAFADEHEGIEPKHAEWLGVSLKIDVEQTRAAIGQHPADWLIVDHYALDSRWERAMRDTSQNIMVIDDLVDRPHDCDLLLDQNLDREAADYAGLVAARCKVLTGPRYALLRPEFSNLREYSKRRRADPALKRILITMGGTDPSNVTGWTLEALKRTQLAHDTRITAVLGSHTPHLADVRKTASQMPWPTEVLVNVGDMARLMADHDLAIGAAGGTAWERCCLGLPSLVAVLADNQRAVATALTNHGAAIPLSMDGFDAFAKSIDAAITTLAATEQLSAISSAAFSVTDGHGVTSVVQKLLQGGIKYHD